MSDEALVWYAAYGSNLLEERFSYYLEGGVLPDIGIPHKGARDATPPRADRALFIPHRLYFAQKARRWGDGGVAFLDARRDETAMTLGRAWLITREQFEDVFRQENKEPEAEIDWTRLLAEGRLEGAEGWYGQILLLEAEREGHPVLTFTSADSSLSGRSRPPSESYLGCIAAGLYETYHLGRKGMVDYLDRLTGVHGAFSKGALGRIWQDVVDALGDEQGEAAADQAEDEGPDGHHEPPDIN